MSVEDLRSKFQKLRSTEFARLGTTVYLDHTGSALYTNSHLKSHFEALENDLLGNPHSGNSCSDRMHDITNQVRLKILQYFNTTSDDYDVVFTSGATEALRLVGRYFNWKAGSTFAYLEDNHTSVVGIREIAAEKGAVCYCLCQDKSKNCSSSLVLNSYLPALVKSMPENNSSVESNGILPCIFAYPAQSNFSGSKYPLEWIGQVQKDDQRCSVLPKMEESMAKSRKWYVLCDAASYVATSFLDLKKYHADFVTVSFYKMFGYPTGLGALLVRKESGNVLCNKTYFGGGAVSGWLASQDFYSLKPSLHDQMEDGTISFLSILALKNGFDTFRDLGLDMQLIHNYTHMLWQKLHIKMKDLCHANGKPVAEVYLAHCPNKDEDIQGPILAFNLKRSDGSYVGYNNVLQLADCNHRPIYLRGGCFCNIGACASLVCGSDNSLLLNAFENGHVCDDKIDIVNGRPIGALRVSLGFSSTEEDIDIFIEFLSDCFRENSVPISQHFEIRQPCDSSNSVLLEKIYIYPVKSAQGMAVDDWEISETGLKYDRMWMVVDERCACLTLKKCDKFVNVYPEVVVSELVLILRAGGADDIEVDDIKIPIIYASNASLKTYSVRSDQTCTTKVCGDKVEAFDCGEEASRWLSKVLGRTCRLLQKNLDKQRLVKERLRVNDKSCEVSLVNEAQYLLVNRGSVRNLYQSLEAASDIDGTFEEFNLVMRFRGNFVVSGALPFAEDNWKRIIVNNAICGENGRLEFAKCGLCTRCAVICVDPVSGDKFGGALQALAKLRLPDNTRRKQTFGIYLQCTSAPSTIRLKSKLLAFN